MREVRGADEERDMQEIRVLVVDGGDALARSLAQALPRRTNVRVLGPVADPLEAAALFDAGTVDVVVVDLDADEGVRSLEAIRDASERVRVVVTTDDDRPAVLANALGAGACGIIAKTVTSEELVRGLRMTVAGELVIPERDLPGVVGRLQGGESGPSAEARFASLTGRENQILRALAEGLPTPEIAALFGISPLTVQSHVKSILAKLGVHSKVEAVTIAWRLGLGVGTRTA